jgi:DNA-binding MarR family transcriptional regulator
MSSSRTDSPRNASAAGPLDRRPGYLLKRAHQAFCAATDAALRSHGLTNVQYGVLIVLEDAGRLSGAELARRCYVTAQAMNDIVVGLERRGLVVRRPHPTHGRVLEASLTEDGRRTLEASHRAVLAVEAKMTGGLDEEERERLAAALRRCVEELEGDPEPTATPGRRRPTR